MLNGMANAALGSLGWTMTTSAAAVGNSQTEANKSAKARFMLRSEQDLLKNPSPTRSGPVPLQKAFNPVECFVQNSHIGQIDQTNVPPTSVRTESAPVDEQDVFLMQQIQHKLLVVVGPNRFRQPYKHVERATRCFHVQAFDGCNPVEAPLTLCLDTFSIGTHP